MIGKTSVLLSEVICKFSHMVSSMQHNNIVISLGFKLLYLKYLKTKQATIFTAHIESRAHLSAASSQGDVERLTLVEFHSS